MFDDSVRGFLQKYGAAEFVALKEEVERLAQLGVQIHPETLPKVNRGCDALRDCHSKMLELAHRFNSSTAKPDSTEDPDRVLEVFREAFTLAAEMLSEMKRARQTANEILVAIRESSAYRFETVMIRENTVFANNPEWWGKVEYVIVSNSSMTAHYGSFDCG